MRWGDSPCIRPPIFGEVVLLETCKSTKSKKPIFLCETDVYRQEKSDIHVCYVIYPIMPGSRDREKTEKRSMTKKSHQKFWALKRTFFLKKVIEKIWSVKIFSAPSKLGARSPPMTIAIIIIIITGMNVQKDVLWSVLPLESK